MNYWDDVLGFSGSVTRKLKKVDNTARHLVFRAGMMRVIKRKKYVESSPISDRLLELVDGPGDRFVGA